MRVVLAVGLGVVLAGLSVAAVLSQRRTHIAGSNTLVRISAVSLPVPGGQRRCALHQDVPAGTVALRVFAGTYRRPRGEPVSLTMTSGGRLIASSSIAGGYPDNSSLRIPLTPIRTTQRDVTVCLRNVGHEKIAFGGNVTSIAGPRYPGPEVPRLDWLLPGRPSDWDLAPKMASRWALFRPSFVGSWTFWALFGVIGLVWVASLGLILRVRPR